MELQAFDFFTRIFHTRKNWKMICTEYLVRLYTHRVYDEKDECGSQLVQ